MALLWNKEQENKPVSTILDFLSFSDNICQIGHIESAKVKAQEADFLFLSSVVGSLCSVRINGVPLAKFCDAN